MLRKMLLMLVCVVVVFPSCTRAADEFDKYGGWKGLSIENKSGFFRVSKVDGRYWFVTPEGHAFWSMGMDWAAGWRWPAGNGHKALTDDWLYYSPPLGYNPTSLGNIAKYGNNPAKWMDSLRSRFHNLGLNNLGGACYQVPEVTQSVELLAFSYKAFDAGCRSLVNIGWHRFVDVFEPRFAETCEKVSASLVKEQANNPYLLGWYIDNELLWSLGDKQSLVDAFIKLPADAPGKRHWVNYFLKNKYANIEALNSGYGTSFTSWDGTEPTSVVNCASLPDDEKHPAIYTDKLDFMRVAVEYYYKTSTDAVRKYDPKHLIFSERLVMGGAHTEVKNKDGSPTYNRPFMEIAWEIAGKYCDVMAVNCYWDINMYEDTHQVWSRMYARSGKPIIFSEWSPKANDSTSYHKWWYATQMDRGDQYLKQTNNMLEMKADPKDPTSDRICVGHQWFCYYDYAPLRTDDDFHTQSGMLNTKDELYTPLTDMIASVNGQVYQSAVKNESVAVLKAPSPLSPVDSDVKTSTPVFRWTSVPGTASYTLLLSPEKCFPDEQTIKVDGIKGRIYRVGASLPSGIWYWTVKGIDEEGRGGQYFKTAKFTVSDVPASEIDVRQNLKCERVDAWSIASNETTQGDGTAYVFKNTKVKCEGESSVHFVFSINSLNLTTGRKNDGKSILPVKWIGPDIDLSGSKSVSFRILPDRFADTNANIVPSTKFLKFRITGTDGSMMLDAAVDPEGKMSIGSFNEFKASLTGMKAKEIVFYIDCGAEGLTWDERLAVNVDDIRWQ